MKVGEFAIIRFTAAYQQILVAFNSHSFDKQKEVTVGRALVTLFLWVLKC
jgi:hypothetical protein